jgi:hypothetical protein
VNRIEADAILTAELAKYEEFDYAELVAMVNEPKVTREVVGPSGARYYVDIRAWWDNKALGHVRVACAVDDGGASAFVPLSGDFIKEPDN